MEYDKNTQEKLIFNHRLLSKNHITILKNEK